MRKTLAILLLAGTTFLAGCGDSEEFVFTPQNPGGVTAPVCQDDAYTTNQNTQLSVNAANGVLANDTPNGGTVTAFDATSTQNGTVNVNGNGSFTYTPANGFTGSDSFTYTLENSGGQVTCTVTITVQAVNGYFVDATNGNDGTGSFNGGLPFATVQAAVANAPTNADIVVRPGNYTGTVNLKDGQRLLGSGSALVNPQGVNRPELTGPVVMADGNTLDFLRLDGTNGAAAECDDQNSGTVTNCEFANTTNTGAGVGGLSVSGTWTITDNTFTSLNGTAIFLTSTIADMSAITIANNSMIDNDLAAVVISSEGGADLRASVVGNVFRNNNQTTGDAFEAFCGDVNSTLCLDLENNINDADSDPNNTDDGVYRFSNGDDSGAVFSVEELVLGPPASVPGNTGTIDIDMGAGFVDPTPVNDGDCGF